MPVLVAPVYGVMDLMYYVSCLTNKQTNRLNRIRQLEATRFLVHKDHAAKNRNQHVVEMVRCERRETSTLSHYKAIVRRVSSQRRKRARTENDMI